MALTDLHKAKIATSLFKDSPEVVARIVELQEILSRREIAKELKIGYATLARIVKRNGISLTTEAKKRAVASTVAVHRGKTPWNKGQTLSDETKAKISEALTGRPGYRMTEEQKIKWRESYQASGIDRIREWFKSEEGKAALARTHSHLRTSEARSKASLTSSRLVEEGRIHTDRGIPSHLVTVKGGEFTTKSSYETRYVAIMEADPEVVAFVYEPFRIPYEFEEVQLWYIPDFLVHYSDGREELVEVKPAKMTTLPKNVSKFAAGEAAHVGFRVVTEEDLVNGPYHRNQERD